MDDFENPENMPEENKPERKSIAASLITAQAVCTVIILIAVLVMKYFFGGYYKTVKTWYDKNFCAETSISEVLEDSGGERDEI